MTLSSLSDYLAQKTASPAKHELAKLIEALAQSAVYISDIASQNGLGAKQLGRLAGGENQDGDSQKQLDVMADEHIACALNQAGASAYFSEERDEALLFDEAAPFAVAADPLDGSSNIDTNMTIGTIFSIFKTDDIQNQMPPHGRAQQAAGLFIYGPQTVLLLSFGDEVKAFALDQDKQFQVMAWDVKIPSDAAEFAINASNTLRWAPEVKAYIDSLLHGGANMRWLGSLVADAYRIFRRGGIFLYPADNRKGYEQGRLRLVYEANPLAFLVEAAGGKATTGKIDILDVPVERIHQRVPLIFGSSTQIKRFLSLIH